jgi:hypothetical protein
MIRLIKFLLGEQERDTDCRGDDCLTESETHYNEAIVEVKVGIERSEGMERRARDLPSWEKLYRERAQ